MSTPRSANLDTENTKNIQSVGRPSSELSNRVAPINVNEVEIELSEGDIKKTNLGNRNISEQSKKVKEAFEDVAYIAKNIGEAAGALKNVPVAKKIAKGVQTTAKFGKNVATTVQGAAERNCFEPGVGAGERLKRFFTIDKPTPEKVLKIIQESVRKVEGALSLLRGLDTMKNTLEKDIPALGKIPDLENIPVIGDKIDELIALLQSLEISMKSLANIVAKTRKKTDQSQETEKAIQIAKTIQIAAQTFNDLGYIAARITALVPSPSVALILGYVGKSVKVLSGLTDLGAKVTEEAFKQVNGPENGKPNSETIREAFVEVMGRQKIKNPSRQRIVQNVARGLDEFGDKISQNSFVQGVNKWVQDISEKIDGSNLGQSLDRLDDKMKNKPIFSPLFRTSYDEMTRLYNSGYIAGEVELGAEIASTIFSILKDLPVAGVGFAFANLSAKLTGFWAGVAKEIMEMEKEGIMRNQGQNQQDLGEQLNPEQVTPEQA